MQIRRRHHSYKQGRLLVWEQTPGTNKPDSFSIEAGTEGSVFVNFDSYKHHWEVVFSREEAEKLAKFISH